MNELEKLYKRKEEIERSCGTWKSCSDGSYEIALSNKGYYVILKEIRKLEKV